MLPSLLLQVLRVAEKDVRKKQQKKEGKKKGERRQAVWRSREWRAAGSRHGRWADHSAALRRSCTPPAGLLSAAAHRCPGCTAAKQEAKQLKIQLQYRPPKPGEAVYKGHHRYRTECSFAGSRALWGCVTLHFHLTNRQPARFWDLIPLLQLPHASYS